MRGRINSWAGTLVVCLLGTGLGLLPEHATARAGCPAVGFTIAALQPAPEFRPVRVGRSHTLYVRSIFLTTTQDITGIQLVRDEGDDASLLIQFNPGAMQRLHDATTNHAGRRLAFMFNDDVLLDVVWEGRFGMDPPGGQVSLRHGLKKAQVLMKAIQGCTATARK